MMGRLFRNGILLMLDVVLWLIRLLIMKFLLLLSLIVVFVCCVVSVGICMLLIVIECMKLSWFDLGVIFNVICCGFSMVGVIVSLML